MGLPESGIGRGAPGEAKPSEIAGGEGGNARRGSACGPRGETRPCGPALDKQEPAGSGEGLLPRGGGLTARDQGRGESDTPDASDAEERRWAVGKGPHPAAIRASHCARSQGKASQLMEYSWRGRVRNTMRGTGDFTGSLGENIDATQR
ncbi:hypothetical protein NDU88_004061 [Pleurodeles waltl]|uniref:Uncharacterized protein n=1 Tax=Pleurodeles waltl TaxID=8319 RepID=A0AAV7PBC8_PLEWA|nr:hypothetical protein NDU88_004061 [Pleurodeles waltl]